MAQTLLNSSGFNQGKLLRALRPFITSALLFITAILTTATTFASDENTSAIHTVVAGDTLYKLAQKYLDDAGRWREFLRDNDVKNPLHLVPDSEIRIPQPAPTVTVIFTQGEITLTSANNTPGKAVEVGDKLAEGAVVSVGNNSYLSLQFADGSIVRVLSDSVLRLQKVREVSANSKPKKVSRIMALEHGDLDISVTPQKSAGSPKKIKPNTFEIVTPMAVAAVRGTRFDVSVSERNTTSGVTQGSVDIRQSKPAKMRAKHVALETGNGVLVNADGKLGAVRQLLPAPDLSAMLDTLNDANTDVSWPELAGAATYHIRIATDADMHKVIQNMESSASSLRPRYLGDGNYVLGVRAVDGDGIIGYEATHAFKIKTQPAFPFYLHPTEQQAVANTVNFECTPVVGASAYHLQISKDENFASPVADVDQLTACSYSISNLENGHYFWRVASIMQSADQGLLHGPFSLPAQFEVVASGSTSTPDNPARAYWITGPGLAYTTQISQDEAFSSIVSEQLVDTPEIALDSLPAGIYYLRLQPQDTEGPVGPFSMARKVEIKAVVDSVERTWADKPK